MRNYKNGPKEIVPIPRMSDSTFHCLIRDSLFRDFAHQYEGENLDRLHGLMHDVAEETLARVAVIAPPVAAGSVDSEAFQDLTNRLFNGEIYPARQQLIAYIDAWGAQQREEGRQEISQLILLQQPLTDAAAAWDRISRVEQRAEKAEKQWHNWVGCSNYWQERAEKAEARVKELEAALAKAYPNAIDPSDTPC